MEVNPFFDNWCYLRTELGWLDRVLSLAVARQRKETKEIEQVARLQSDRVTSHWWKGIISIDGAISSDSPAEFPRKSGSGLSYQQQMETKIRVSQQKGIALGLPTLCQRLHLTPFEKNVVLMALAPEVSRRYGKLYAFLQDSTQSHASGLPTVDLLLRLLCRNDAEWRSARSALAKDAPLIQRGVVMLPDAASGSFLEHSVKLADSVVEYLLAGQPDINRLDRWLEKNDSLSVECPLPDLSLETWALKHLITKTGKVGDHGDHLKAGLPHSAPKELLPKELLPKELLPKELLPKELLPKELLPKESLWTKLVLPEPFVTSLRHLGDRIQYAQPIEEQWGFQSTPEAIAFDNRVLFVGEAGTGKTTAAKAIAQQTQISLISVDLSCLSLPAQNQMLQDFRTETPTVLLLKSAQCWLGRDAVLSAEIKSFLADWHRAIALTIFSVHRKEQVKPSWQRQINQIFIFPKPNQASRLQMWRQAFPAQVPLATDIDWNALARLSLSAAEIQAIAREAAIYAMATGSSMLMMAHLHQACCFKQIKF
jgi:hypothetical protein